MSVVEWATSLGLDRNRFQLELMALAVIEHLGSDQIGMIDSEEKAAAAICYGDLADKGHLQSNWRYGDPQIPGGPTYTITPAGIARLRAAGIRYDGTVKSMEGATDE